MAKIKTIGYWVLIVYMFLGVSLSFYMDYELISEKGFWAYLWLGDDHGMYNILLWPFYIF